MEEIDIKNPFDYMSFIGKGLLVANCSKRNSITVDTLTYSYTLDLYCPNRKRLEVSKNVKYIAVTSRASKLQVFKVRPGRALNPGHPRESLNIRKLTHAHGPSSNPGQVEL